jgi:glycosyltransferase involved in cell wall biosynthesis
VSTPRFSFVIPVLNDARRLATCLQSIRRNLSADGSVEIVVVDNGSIDGSPDVARRFGASVVVAEGRVSELRNIGAARATGDVLAFVDADHEIGAGWLVAAREVLGKPRVGAVGATYRPPLHGTWVQQAYGQLRGHAAGQHEVDWLGSGNLAVWRHAFEQVGGFDISLEACEDVDLCQRIRAAGHRLVSDARLDTIHHGDP